MAKPNTLTTLSANRALDGVYAFDGEDPEMNKAFLRYVREARSDESPEEFVRREYSGNSVIREAALSNEWMSRRMTLIGNSRDIATKQAQSEMAESTRKLMPVINDVTDILKDRLSDLRRANVSIIDPSFEVLFRDVERVARTLASLQTSLAKQQTINILNNNSSSASSGVSEQPKFAGWGNVIDHQK